MSLAEAKRLRLLLLAALEAATLSDESRASACGPIGGLADYRRTALSFDPKS